MPPRPPPLQLNINAVYANGLTPAEVDLAPPMNVNPSPHLHTLKCQIPSQIICFPQRSCPHTAGGGGRGADGDSTETVWSRLRTATNPHLSPFRLSGHGGFRLCKMKVMGWQWARLQKHRPAGNKNEWREVIRLR